MPKVYIIAPRSKNNIFLSVIPSVNFFIGAQNFNPNTLLDNFTIVCYYKLYSNYKVKEFFMNNLFTVGELAKLQNISRQTLIFYDKIGLFCPAYTNPDNGYRYYGANQLDYLDTVCIMKKIGFSLEEIKAHMKGYTIDNSIVALKKQILAIENKIEELQLIKSRAEHRCAELEHAVSIREKSDFVTVENVERRYLLVQKVNAPNSSEQVSIATKECFVRAFREKLPVFFQSGAIIPYENIENERYAEASYVFLPIEKTEKSDDIIELPAGKCVCTYHTGDYLSTGSSYKRLLSYCSENNLRIISDSYEFAINDYLSTGDENEYITKIMFYTEA